MPATSALLRNAVVLAAFVSLAACSAPAPRAVEPSLPVASLPRAEEQEPPARGDVVVSLLDGDGAYWPDLVTPRLTSELVRPCVEGGAVRAGWLVYSLRLREGAPAELRLAEASVPPLPEAVVGCIATALGRLTATRTTSKELFAYVGLR